MCGTNGSDNRQPESRTSVITRASRVNAVESIKYVRQRSGGNPNTGIGYPRGRCRYPSDAVRRATSPPRGVKRMALSRRLTMICLESPPIPHTTALCSADKSISTSRSSAIRRICSAVLNANCAKSTSTQSPCVSPASSRDNTSSPDTKCSPTRDFFEDAAHAFAYITLA